RLSPDFSGTGLAASRATACWWRLREDRPGGGKRCRRRRRGVEWSRMTLVAGTSVEKLDCEHLFDGRQTLADMRVTIRDGEIETVTPIPVGDTGAQGDNGAAGTRVGFAMPGLVDA